MTWEELTDLIAREIDRVRTKFGNEAIYGGSYGWGSAGRFHHAQSQVHRFLNVLGGYTRSVNTYSHAADEVVLPHLVGDREWFLRHIPRWSQVLEHTQFVLAFGGLPRRSVQVSPGGIGSHLNASWQDRCAEAGVEFAIVSPNRADTGEKLRNEWLAIRPGTDVALMLAMCHVLLTEDLYDRYFVDCCCVGFDDVAAYLTGDAADEAPKTPEWASVICDIPAEDIRRMARRLAGTRSIVSVTWSLQRQHHGEMAYWAGMTLAAMAGSMGLPGGGFVPGLSSMHSAWVGPRVSMAGALPQGKNPVGHRIPVARIADLLLRPGEEFDYDGVRARYPAIHLVYWVGGNPFHHAQNLNRLVRAWQQPDTIITHEPYWTSSAKHADIVVPVATSLEREDLALGSGDAWLVHNDAVAEPPPGIVTDYEVFGRICDRLGVEEEFTEGRDIGDWVREIYARTVRRCADAGIDLPDYRAFREAGAIELPLVWSGPVAFAELRESPEERPLATPSGRLELYSSRVAGFGYEDCPGQATWMEPAEWLGSPLAERFSLHLVSPQPDGKLHSQYDAGQESSRFKRHGRTVLWMHPADASSRGIDDGDIVEVWNDRGCCLAAAGLTADLRSGVVQLPTGSWYDPVDPGVPGSLDKHGNPNVLTSDLPTSRLAQGPAAHTCLVEVRPWSETPPPVTAYEPPRLITPSNNTDQPGSPR